MDSGNGTFKSVEREEVNEMIRASIEKPSDRRIDKVFSIGEEVGIKASKFTVRHIDHVTGIMVLKLMPEKKF